MSQALIWKPALAITLMFTILVSIAWAFKSGEGLRDFRSFIASGEAASRGENAYGVYEDTYTVSYRGESIAAPNLNPPVSIYPFQALAALDKGDAKLGLQLVSIAVYSVVLLALLKASRHAGALQLLWALALRGSGTHWRWARSTSCSWRCWREPGSCSRAAPAWPACSWAD